jgi:thiamine-phosphate pyrophosphorylase
VKSPLPASPFLYPIVDVGLVGERRVAEVVGALVQGGARILQLRAKGVSDRRLVELAREALDAAREGGALLLVNDRPDVAHIVGADGVHVGQEDLAPGDVRAVLGPDAIIGLSTHNVEQLRRAAGEPVDYVAVGPVFPTSTKAHPDPVVGLDLVREARKLVTQPLVAIGGIRQDNARAVVEAGADGVAVASALLTGPDSAALSIAFHAALRGGAGVGELEDE